jgi:hypothetical protein
MELRLKGGVWPGTAASGSYNTSGLGVLSKAPAEISGWNWGAFFLTWIWGIGNNVWIALIALCGILPYIGWIVSLVMAIILGVRGNEWAWQSKRWDSIEHFQKTQRTWMWWGLGVFLLQIALVVAVTILIFSLIMIAATAGLDGDLDWRSVFPSM